jgi:hypothetical protein
MAAEVREELSAGLDFDEDDDHPPNPPPRTEPPPDESVAMDDADSGLGDDDWDRRELAEPGSRAEQRPPTAGDSDADGKVARDTP